MTRIRTFLIVLGILAVAASGADAALRVVVKPGDTLAAIGQRHGVGTLDLARRNQLRNPAVLQIGMTLTIPGATGVAARRTATATGVYVVRSGDTLAAIAARSGTSMRRLVSLNGLSNPHTIVIGARLRVSANAPASSSTARGSYLVRSGDTLSSIAARRGVTATSLARLNGLRNPNRLRIGQRLRVAGAATTSSTAVRASSGSGYRVRPGDTLAGIAARLGTSPSALAARNGIRHPNRLRIGLLLRIPAGLTQRTSTTPVTAATAGWAGQPGRAQVRALIARSASRHGVDPALVRAVAWQESGWWQGARSSTGAIGVMQLMPTTAQWAGPALLGRRIDPTRVEDNVDTGTAYLAWLLRRAPTRDRAIASYYQGLASVSSRGLYDDTKAYVRSVNGHYGHR